MKYAYIKLLMGEIKLVNLLEVFVTFSVVIIDNKDLIT